MPIIGETLKWEDIDAVDSLWVFGYGSLMWNPEFAYNHSAPATVKGFHRSFCVYSWMYRGTEECPGLVVGLDDGGECVGRAFEVDDQNRREVVDYLRNREMNTGIYREAFVDAVIDGKAVKVLTYVVDHDSDQYSGHLSLDETAKLILQGHGSRGPCTDYLFNTYEHLLHVGIDDPEMSALVAAVKKDMPQN